MTEPMATAVRKFMVTPEQAAEMLSVDRKTVLKFIRDGKLKASKLSPKVLRIRVSDLEQFIEAYRL